MPKIIRNTRHVDCIEYSLSYSYPGTGAGYGFDCDSEGNVLEEALSPAAMENLTYCRRAVLTGELICDGVKDYTRTVRLSRVIQCDCRREVELDDAWLNTCECGRDYSGNGDLLAPRSQWGEETGESLADIIGPRTPDWF